jgi:hypothetical protein
MKNVLSTFVVMAQYKSCCAQLICRKIPVLKNRFGSSWGVTFQPPVQNLAQPLRTFKYSFLTIFKSRPSWREIEIPIERTELTLKVDVYNLAFDWIPSVCCAKRLMLCLKWGHGVHAIAW